MEKYLKALDKYISLKIKYSNFDLENDLKYIRESHNLENARADMETSLKILINK